MRSQADIPSASSRIPAEPCEKSLSTFYISLYKLFPLSFFILIF
jgi:hypothetical protein